jgi:hypothetical protein
MGRGRGRQGVRECLAVMVSVVVVAVLGEEAREGRAQNTHPLFLGA